MVYIVALPLWAVLVYLVSLPVSSAVQSVKVLQELIQTNEK